MRQLLKIVLGIAIGIAAVIMLLVGLLALSFHKGELPRAGVAESKARGDPIVAALDKYHADRGVYPKTLAELVPKYINEIQLPTVADRKWHYDSGNGEAYALRFGDPSGNGAYVIIGSSQKTWLECSAGF